MYNESKDRTEFFRQREFSLYEVLLLIYTDTYSYVAHKTAFHFNLQGASTFLNVSSREALVLDRIS